MVKRVYIILCIVVTKFYNINYYLITYVEFIILKPCLMYKMTINGLSQFSNNCNMCTNQLLNTGRYYNTILVKLPTSIIRFAMYDIM